MGFDDCSRSGMVDCANMIGILVLLLFGGYLALSLLGGLQANPGYWAMALALGALLLSQVWLFLVFFRSDSEEPLRFEKPLKRFAFHSMGLLSLLFTFSAMRDLIALPLRTVGQEDALYGPAISSGILLLSALTFLRGFWIARNHLQTPEIAVAAGDLGDHAVRVAQISDLHLGTGPDLQRVREIVQMTLANSPDLIVLTGDIIDGAIPDIEEELSVLATLKAPLGVYFVLGNHECYWNATISIQAIEACGIQPLVNEGRSIQSGGRKIFIAGVSDPAYRHFGGPGPVIPIPPPDASLRILLAHQPQIAKKVAELSYDLQLSGHTHGGQFFPWNLAVNWMYPHPRGLHRLKNLWIYVHSGTGFWGPPLRLGTRAEIATLRVGGINS